MFETDFEGIDFRSAASLNNHTLMDYYFRLKMLALVVYEWIGLPDSCDERFLEQTLYRDGQAIFVYDEEMGCYLNLNVAPSANLDVYYRPLEYRAYSLNYNKTYSNKDCVIFRNNSIMRATHQTLRLFAYRLYERERTIDTNITLQKFPGFVTTDESRRLTVENLMMQYKGNVPIVIGDKSQGLTDAIKTIRFDAPYVADKVRADLHEIWNDALTFLGINNANTHKREREIVDEVNANNESIMLHCDVGLSERIKSANEINKKYGLNVSVRKRTSNEIFEMIGGDEIGEVHNDNSAHD